MIWNSSCICRRSRPEHMPKYEPRFQITATIVSAISQISELLGRLSVQTTAPLSPTLRRGNRIRTIQASLAIEHNTLSVEQVTAIMEGKRVMGLPREIQEVRNALATYEKLDQWNPAALPDLLEAHAILMQGLVDDAGTLRRKGVGIYRDDQLVHMAPPASQLNRLMKQLLYWLDSTDTHPLIASCVFHYEFEFIHPFSDGNGRMGRLWQSLILSRWKPVLAYLPVETLIHQQQQQYYQALSAADRASDVTAFVEFMLNALLQALRDLHNHAASDQVDDQVSDQVATLLRQLKRHRLASSDELMQALGLKHKPTFRKNYLNPALAQGLISMTDPSPRSPRQRYQLTPQGSAWLQQHRKS